MNRTLRAEMIIKGLLSIAVLGFILISINTLSVSAQSDTVTVRVISSNASGMSLKIDFPDFRENKVQIAGYTFDVLEIPGCGGNYEPGKPALPRYGMMVALNLLRPGDVVVVYEIDNISRTLTNYSVYPAQEQGYDQPPPFPTPDFTMNETFYNTSQFYPDQLIEYGPIGTLREMKVLPIRVAAFQHNPVTRQLIVYSSITVRIEYPRLGEPPKDSGYFEGIYSALVGYEQSRDLRARGDADAGAPLGNAGNGGCDFLIITVPELEPAADNLSAWRNAQGIETLVVNTTVTGNTSEQIKAYIQDAYDNWTPSPSFLLLLGDADHIPPFYRTVHRLAGDVYPEGHRIGTDLYYAILNGPEPTAPYYSEYETPDLFHGRISVENLTEANTMIAKIFEYENEQWICGENESSVCGYFQEGSPVGYEDEYFQFIYTTEKIRDFLLSEGFLVDRLYTTEPTVNPTNYTFFSGLPLPADLLRPTYPWNASAADITAAINDGRFMVVHRDHGNSLNRPNGTVEGWRNPEYGASDVQNLSNSDHYTILFSINCETGWFDGETDDNYTRRNFDCLCEALLREPDGGAVGAFGATRASASGWNNDLAKGFIDAIWPNFDPAQGSATPLLRAGEILNYGLQYMSLMNFPIGFDPRQQYEIFHYFGDPTMEFKIPTREPPLVVVGGPYAGDENETIEFNISVPVACSAIHYEWDFDNDSSFEVNSTMGTINHTWCDNGNYPIMLRATDEEGFSSTANISVNISNIAPTVNAGLDLDAYEQDLVEFNGSFTDPGCDSWTFEWDFGDESSITGTLTPTHVYTQPGIYTVNLTVKDDDGGVGSDTLNVTVYSLAPTTSPSGLVVLLGLLAACAVISLSVRKRH